MIRTQVYLTREEQQKLQILSRNLDTSQSVLIRQAIDQFIAHQFKQQKNQCEILQAAKGLWADRHDLPDWRVLRKEFDRDSEK